ncbi:hypothetical protein ACT1U9_00530 [Streptomyces sp. BR1]
MTISFSGTVYAARPFPCWAAGGYARRCPGALVGHGRERAPQG